MKNLNTKIENLTFNIEDDSSDHKSYYLRAKAYVDLASLEKDLEKVQNYHNKALSDYKEAISLYDQDAMYSEIG